MLIFAQFTWFDVLPAQASTNEKILFGSQSRGVITSINPDGSDPVILSKGYHPSVSPDGTKILYNSLAKTPGNTNLYDLFVRDKNGNVVNLTNTSNSQEDLATWSPDGQHILYRSYTQSTNTGGFFIMNVDGSNQHRILPLAESASYSPDGTKIVSVEHDPNNTNYSLDVSDADGNNLTTLFTTGWGIEEPTWSPDGQHIAWRDYCQSPSPNTSCISVMNTDGSNIRDIFQSDLSNGGHDYEQPAWSPDSLHIIVTGLDNGTLYSIPASGGSAQQIYASPTGDQLPYPTWTYIDSSYTPLARIATPFGPFTKYAGAPFTLTATITGNASSIVSGAYWVGPMNIDPGSDGGHLGTLINTNGVLSSAPDDHTFTNLPVGSYRILAATQDTDGDWSEIIESQLTVVNDSTPPTMSSFNWSQNPKPTTSSTTLTVPATDDSSGIQKAEYFIGDTDPGQGNGATMQLSNVANGGLSADLTTTFGTDFPTGVYKISVRAEDNAGNWSAPISDYLVVYDPTGLKMTGKRTIVPSLANGDVLPGLIASNQTDQAKFGFSVKYDNQGQISGNSDFMFSYNTGAHCNKPAQATNCHSLSLDSTSIAWLTTQDANNSTGIFQGNATLTVDGQTNPVLFRVTGVDGTRLSSTANDRFQLQIYAQGANPASAQPLYRVNMTDIARGNITIDAPSTPLPPPPRAT